MFEYIVVRRLRTNLAKIKVISVKPVYRYKCTSPLCPYGIRASAKRVCKCGRPSGKRFVSHYNIESAVRTSMRAQMRLPSARCMTRPCSIMLCSSCLSWVTLRYTTSGRIRPKSLRLARCNRKFRHRFWLTIRSPYKSRKELQA